MEESLYRERLIKVRFNPLNEVDLLLIARFLIDRCPSSAKCSQKSRSQSQEESCTDKMLSPSELCAHTPSSQESTTVVIQIQKASHPHLQTRIV